MSSGIDDGLTMSEVAYRQIEQMIVVRALRPGSMISEKQLCEELDCGRTPVREALQRLRLEGYIDILPSRGAMVAPIDIVTQLELLEVRRPLEDLAVRLAARRATSQERDAMRGLVSDLRSAAEAEDQTAFLVANRALQEALQVSARNAVLVNTSG